MTVHARGFQTTLVLYMIQIKMHLNNHAIFYNAHPFDVTKDLLEQRALCLSVQCVVCCLHTTLGLCIGPCTRIHAASCS